MSKQRLERDLSKTLFAKYSNFYYLKLQVMPLSCTAMPGDFMVLTDSNNYLIECKQCDGDRFVFDRLTQENSLLSFESILQRNKAFVLIMFYHGRLLNSEIYMLPIVFLADFISGWSRKSINYKDAKVEWADFLISVEKGGVFNINVLK